MAAQTSYTPAQMSNPDIIVSPQFLAPYPVDLTITTKLVSLSLGKFSVTDVNGNVVFKVKPKKISLHDRHSLLDAADNPILSFRKKVRSAHNKWVVFKGDSSDLNDIIFTGMTDHAPSMPERAPQSLLRYGSTSTDDEDKGHSLHEVSITTDEDTSLEKQELKEYTGLEKEPKKNGEKRVHFHKRR
ncbi:protein LURP-one-related 15 [Tanacetum coccineum]|uniref:Protein LURP-one-related 15 n=1 Tax=Tanacetum coccineum TaxID=301880 RepID=A0ABQ5E2M4_9ASTR